MFEDLRAFSYGHVGSSSVDLVCNLYVGVLVHVICDLCEGECAPGACVDGVGGCLMGDEDCLDVVWL